MRPALITLIPKADKDITKKYRLISLMNINEIFCNAILANQLQQCIKKYYITRLRGRGLSQVYKAG